MVLKTCRCCCGSIKLEKATKLIGIVFTINGVISVLSLAVRLGKLDELAQHQDTQWMYGHSRNLLVARLCSAVLLTLFSVILVAGVYRKNRNLVLTFVIFFVLYLAVGTTSIFYAFYDPTAFIDGATIDDLREQSIDVAKAVIYAGLIIVLAIFAFLWYLAYVVYSYYKEMTASDPKQEHRQMC